MYSRDLTHTHLKLGFELIELTQYRKGKLRSGSLLHYTTGKKTRIETEREADPRASEREKEDQSGRRGKRKNRVTITSVVNLDRLDFVFEVTLVLSGSDSRSEPLGSTT